MVAFKFAHTLPSALCFALTASVAIATSAAAPDPATLRKISALSVPFVPNAGQWNERAAFAAQTFAGTLFVTQQGELVYSLPGKPITPGADLADGNVGADSAARETPSRRLQRPAERTPGWVLSETLVDATGKPRSMSQSTLKAPAGYRPMEGKVSYGIGNNPAKHADNLNTYERVNLGDMYPGINVQLRATGNNVEKIFTVAPQHDPKQIRIKLAGADKLEIGPQGELIAHTGNGPVAFTAPIAFQDTAAGERTSIAVAYALNATEQRYGFTLGAYDVNQPLVIDPLLQSTYLGGTGDEVVTALAIHHATGEVYIAGYTDSADLPSVTVASGGVGLGAQSVKSTGTDAFVTRFNAALTSRLQSTYLGGTGTDVPQALAIHPATGDIYIAGYTDSTDLPSVTVASGGVGLGAQSVKSTGSDAFVTRFSAALTSRLQSTYLGGTGSDAALALAIQPATGDIYIAGYTDSTDLPSVTVTSGGLSLGAQSVKSTGSDAFVTRFNAALTSRLQSTYLGGTGSDYARALAIHPASGEVLIAGDTNSIDLPSVTVASGGVGLGAQIVKSTGVDAFVTRLNGALTSRLQSTYLGGTGNDYPQALAIHPATGEVLIAGYTDSTDLPSVTVASGGLSLGAQSVKSAGIDAFVTRFNGALTQRLQSTYLGGTGSDAALALAIHPATGEVLIAGFTDSTDLPSVTVASGGLSLGAQSVKSTGRDAFVTRFNGTLTSRLQSTYLGGTGLDDARALAIHPATGEVVIAGFTSSTDLPGVTVASGGVGLGAQSVKSTSYDAFVTKFSFDLVAGDFVPNAFAFAPRLNVPLRSVQTSDAAQITGVSGNVPVSITGGNFAEFCISSGPNCGCDVQPFTSTTASINNNQYVCVRQVAPASTPAQIKTTLVVGGGWANFLVTTGLEITSCNLDIDGSGGAPNPVSDGLMLVRAMLGFTGLAVTNGAIVGTPPRNTWALIRTYLNDNCGTSFLP